MTNCDDYHDKSGALDSSPSLRCEFCELFEYVRQSLEDLKVTLCKSRSKKGIFRRWTVLCASATLERLSLNDPWTFAS